MTFKQIDKDLMPRSGKQSMEGTMMTRIKRIFCISIAFAIFPSIAFAQPEKTTTDRVSEAARNLANKQKFELKYQFKIGEEIRWQVEHVATTKAQISGKHETTSSRTQSTKLWEISSIDSIGNITFVHSVESTTLWQQIGDEDPTSFDSTSTEDVPEQFVAANEMIGKPLAVVTISPFGQVIDRKTGLQQISFGVGDICTPLPAKPVAVGYRWFVPTDFDATDEDGRRLKLKARINYQLTKVVDGMAIISFRTEVLTPVESDQVRSQLLQKLNNGYVAFDLRKGRLDAKEIKWNEKVQEYAGPDSFLHYTGRMTEQIVVSDSTNSKKPRVSAAAPSVKIKRPGEKPIIRK